jgi:hypothetical protein
MGGGGCGILTVDAYFKMDLSTPIFLGEVSKQYFTKE